MRTIIETYAALVLILVVLGVVTIETTKQCFVSKTLILDVIKK
jgi:uncharacterized membrane protein